MQGGHVTSFPASLPLPGTYGLQGVQPCHVDGQEPIFSDSDWYVGTESGSLWVGGGPCMTKGKPPDGNS